MAVLLLLQSAAEAAWHRFAPEDMPHMFVADAVAAYSMELGRQQRES